MGLAAVGLAGLGVAGNMYVHKGANSLQPAPNAPANVQRFSSASTQHSSSKAKFRPALGSISINQGDQKELEQLPGVGPSIAQKIIEYRSTHGGFKTIEEIDAVKGIGPKKLENIRPYVRL